MPKGIIVSGPVILKNDQILLDKSGDDDFWKFCGGKVKMGETFTETAIRRAKEELGIDVVIIDDNPFVKFIKKTTPEGEDQIMLLHFLSDLRGNICPGVGVREWKWISILELDELEKKGELAPNIIPALKHFRII